MQDKKDGGRHPQQLPAIIAVRDMIVGAALTQMICVAAELEIADLLNNGQKTSDELAELTNTNPKALYRLLRALASKGIFRETENKNFELTPMADCLRKDAKNSIRAYALWGGSKCWWRPWEHLMHSVKTGETAFRKVFDMELFDYFAQDPEISHIFNTFMDERIEPIAKAICDAYDFSSKKTIVDIGGGHGLLIATILNAVADMKGILFDLPEVVAHAPNILENQGVANRCEVVGGSFFDSVPASGDIYILSAIIHDWDDETSVKILKNCCKHMNADSRLLIVDAVIPQGNAPSYSKLTDLNMLVLASGRERTETEFNTLLKTAGLEMARIIPTEIALSIVEARLPE